MACRQCWDAAEATCDDVVQAVGGWSADDGGKPTICLSPSKTHFAGVWPAFRDDYQPLACIGSPEKAVDQMTTRV